eukprot:CAMPEP_0204336354 /NCGR_PEP_ID=MMETSP0469-20131031/19467_1 /ASSEMBLY_ACC=CAM_ASM_000384 /TAXON_ID=2969 /ORGANISM="Oxyrrhis marina" /LENGTH=275 /DNA_ID=CAMNT_0051320205 /DNA_START=29 /DNA_END=853 /DNA_ORIENTATION=-
MSTGRKEKRQFVDALETAAEEEAGSPDAVTLVLRPRQHPSYALLQGSWGVYARLSTDPDEREWIAQPVQGEFKYPTYFLRPKLQQNVQLCVCDDIAGTVALRPVDEEDVLAMFFFRPVEGTQASHVTIRPSRWPSCALYISNFWRHPVLYCMGDPGEQGHFTISGHVSEQHRRKAAEVPTAVEVVKSKPLLTASVAVGVVAAVAYEAPVLLSMLEGDVGGGCEPTRGSESAWIAAKAVLQAEPLGRRCLDRESGRHLVLQMCEVGPNLSQPSTSV